MAFPNGIMKLLSIISVTICIFNTSHAADTLVDERNYAAQRLWSDRNICVDKKFRDWISHTTQNPLNDFRLPPKSGKRVLLLGEEHYTSSATLRPQIVQTLAPQLQGRKCMFMEFNSSITADELVTKVSQALRELPPGHLQERKDYTELIQYYGSIVEAAKKAELKIFLVDHKDNWGQGMADDIRNKAMAENIEALLKNNQCDQALMFIGKAHITFTKDPEEVTLKSLLASDRVPLVTFNIQAASDPGPENFQAWDKACEDQIVDLNHRTIVFPTSKITFGDSVWPKIPPVGGGFWFDFDYVILSPQ